MPNNFYNGGIKTKPLGESIGEFGDMSDEMVSQFSKIMASRQKAREMQAGQVNKQLSDEKKRLEKEQLDQDTNPQSMALTGASLGTMVSPGMGTVIGAIAGGVIGLGKSVASQHEAGKGVWDITKNVGNHLLNPVQVSKDAYEALAQPGGIQKAASVAGGMKQKFNQPKPVANRTVSGSPQLQIPSLSAPELSNAPSYGMGPIDQSAIDYSGKYQLKQPDFIPGETWDERLARIKRGG